MILIYLINLLFYMSVIGFCLNYNYYLKSLVMIEFIMISLMLIILMGEFGLCHYLLYILILGVCEGIMGLLMVIIMCRGWGIDSYMLVDYSV